MVEQVYDLGKRNDGVFLRQVVRASWIILFLAIVYQLIFFPDITNITGMAAVVFGWFIATKVWLQSKMLESYLISAFMLLGFVASQFYFPLLFTTLENKPLIFNLELPEQVFLHSTLCLVVLLLAHTLYRFIMRSTPDRSVSLMSKAGFFDPPSHLQLWIMGVFGMASSFYVHLASPEVGQGVTGAPGDKFVQALVPFIYAPYFIPISKLFGNNEKPGKKYVLMIVMYSVFMFLISMARNSRGAFIFGLTTPAFAYALGLLLGVYKTRIFTFKNVFIGGLLFWLLTGPFTDLGTAMLIVRGTRAEIPPDELIMLTFDALEDKEAIRARQADDVSESLDSDWDERYLNNIFTARFANIKFNDMNLITYSKVGEYDPDMQDYSIDQLLASLPDPVLKALNLDVDKEGILTLSFGDFMYVVSGGFGTPAGLRLGHVAGTGMATFGWWYLALFGLVMMPIFYLNDKFFRTNKGAPLSALPEDRIKVSFCGVLALTPFFQFLLLESVVAGATYLLRGWLQMVILYALIFHVSRLINNAVVGKRRRFRLSEN